MGKIIVISDLHLSNKFEKSLFDNLIKVFKSADQIIMNGDFWDDSLTTFDEFLESDWKELFPFLKEKNCVYLHGNHDPMYFCDDRVLAFCDHHGLDYEFEFNNDNFFVTHGQVFSKVTRMAMFLKHELPFIYNIVVSPLRIMMRYNENKVKSGSYELVKNLNHQFKGIVDPSKFLVMGHTHIPEIDLENKYLNSGYCRHGFCSYIVFTEDENPELIEYKY